VDVCCLGDIQKGQHPGLLCQEQEDVIQIKLSEHAEDLLKE
jgi:hypothetical protein